MRVHGHIQVIGQLSGLGFLFLPCLTWGSNSVLSGSVAITLAAEAPYKPFPSF